MSDGLNIKQRTNMSENANESCDAKIDQSPGLFSWHEMVTQDVEGSRKFYTEMFGWTVQSMDMGEAGQYHMFLQGKRPV